jgi:hypothetical protein
VGIAASATQTLPAPGRWPSLTVLASEVRLNDMHCCSTTRRAESSHLLVPSRVACMSAQEDRVAKPTRVPASFGKDAERRWCDCRDARVEGVDPTRGWRVWTQLGRKRTQLLPARARGAQTAFGGRAPVNQLHPGQAPPSSTTSAATCPTPPTHPPTVRGAQHRVLCLSPNPD